MNEDDLERVREWLVEYRHYLKMGMSSAELNRYFVADWKRNERRSAVAKRAKQEFREGKEVKEILETLEREATQARESGYIPRL